MVDGARGPVPAVATPQPPRVGLIASAAVLESPAAPVDSTDDNPQTRWEAGFAWEPENYCSGGGVTDPCGTSEMSVGDGLPVEEYDPVLLWAGDKCTSMDRQRDRAGRARRRLLACQSKLLAGELWNGTLAQAAGLPNKYLASDDANTISGNNSLNPVNALACLEEALADCSCTTAMIHATPGLLTHWFGLRLVERMGNLFRTGNDTIVVADAGYTGDGPDGQPPVSDSVWAYATDLVSVRLGAIQVLPVAGADSAAMTIGRTPDNLLTYRAQRLAAASWDGCCHLAVEVDIEVCADLAAS